MTSIGQGTSRRHRVGIPVFGIILTIVGTVLLLNTFDVLRWVVWLDMWRLWPLLLVLAGLKLLFRPFHPMLMLLISVAAVGGAVGFAFAVSEGELFTADFTTFNYEIERSGSESLDLDLNFGAGTLRVQPLLPSDQRLLAVEFFDDEDDVDISAKSEGGTREVSINLSHDGIPFISRGGDDRQWTVLINPAAVTNLNIDGGAGKFVLDLTDTSTVRFEVDIGAAQLDVLTPAAGQVVGSIDAGAADVSVTVPSGVAARIDNESGVSSVDIDSDRFPKSGGIHQSVGYADASNRLQLTIRAGVSSIVVK